MEQIYVKLRQREKEKYRKLLSVDRSLFMPPTISEGSKIQYAPGILLEEDEWFYVSNASQQNYSIDILSADFSSLDFRGVERKDFVRIDFLFVISGTHIFFQNVTKTKLISKRCIFAIGEEFQYQDDRNEITINDSPDAIYDMETDTLYFKRLESLTGIFRGIEQLYREATEEEIEEFLGNDFIALKGGYSACSVKTANRKRIALALKTLSSLTEKDRRSIYTYIGNYCPELKVSEQSFEIASEEDMKKLLYGIEQRFYTTPVGGEKRIANSVIPLT